MPSGGRGCGLTYTRTLVNRPSIHALLRPSQIITSLVIPGSRRPRPQLLPQLHLLRLLQLVKVLQLRLHGSKLGLIYTRSRGSCCCCWLVRCRGSCYCRLSRRRRRFFDRLWAGGGGQLLLRCGGDLD